MPNALASSRSAYLRSAAHQPVDWLPWSAEAFERARREDKPILLDIGAVWCHWCHVIDRESYDDPALAAIINEHFVAVKVDRDERPDVDARYQAAVQALTGQGGWPLTAFLTPEGKVFFGGTYFPPDDKYGRPGFRTVLERIREHYKERREDLLAHSEHLHLELERAGSRHAPGELRAELVDRAVEGLGRHYDVVNGGFGTAPKFPHPSGVELALGRYVRTQDGWLRTILEGTLTGMARGGVHDHLGGGFHRYSVDAEWIVPHFEKMLYDNAGLLRNYSQAWLVLQDPEHRAAAEGIVRWLRDTMERPEGGFAGSQDADVGLDDDGDHWTWTVDELRAAVPDADLQGLLREHFDVGERGEMHHDPRKNVLWVAKTAEQLARERGLPLAMVERRLAEGKALLLRARAQRPVPFVDPTVYVSWNGMAAGALLEAWKALGDPWCRDAALRALDRVLREAHTPGEGVAHVLREGGAEVRGLLEDQAWAAHALLEAYACTGDARWLDAGQDILDAVLARFEDPDGGFLDVARGRAGEAPVLASKRKPIEDAPSASPTSVAILALQHLADLTGEARYRDAAARALRAFAGSAPNLGLFASAYFLALERQVQEHTQVVIVGPVGREETRLLHEAALRTVDPLLAVLPPTDAAHVPEPARAAVLSGIGEERAVALVCRGTSCSPPARSHEELERYLGRRGAPVREGPAARWEP